MISSGAQICDFFPTNLCACVYVCLCAFEALQAPQWVGSYYCWVTQSCLIFYNPWTVVRQVPLSMAFLGKNPGWVAISYSRGSSWPRDRTHISWVSCIGRRILHHCVTRVACKFLLSLKFYLFSKLFPESPGRINHTKKFPQYFVYNFTELKGNLETILVNTLSPLPYLFLDKLSTLE